MHIARLFFLALVPTLAAASAVADSLPQLVAGEAIAIVPDGHIGRAMVTDAEAMADWIKTAKQIPFCAKLLKGEDGNVYLVNTTTHYPMVACEDMAPN